MEAYDVLRYACRTLFSVFRFPQRMPAQLFADARMLAPEIVAHSESRESIPDGHVPPRQVAQQRLGQQRHQDVEPHLEETEADNHEKQRRRRILDFRGEGGGDAPDNDERADVNHRVAEDPAWLDHDRRGVMRGRKQCAAEHCWGEEWLTVDGIDEEKPDGDDPGADATGDKAFAQDAVEIHLPVNISRRQVRARLGPTRTAGRANGRDAPSLVLRTLLADRRALIGRRRSHASVARG